MPSLCDKPRKAWVEAVAFGNGEVLKTFVISHHVGYTTNSIGNKSGFFPRIVNFIKEFSLPFRAYSHYVHVYVHVVHVSLF